MFSIKTGQLTPALRAVLSSVISNVKAPYDLTGKLVQVRFRNALTNVVTLIATTTIENAVQGLVRYDWNPGDTSTPGTYQVDFIVMDATNPDPNDPIASITIPTMEFLTVQILPAIPE